MRKQILILALFALVLTGCKEKTEETPETRVPIAEEAVPETDEIKTECYIYNEKGSVISLQLSYNENNTSAILTYALKEKDRNFGSVDGKIENNIYIGDYKFLSEGTESTRQVAFQLKGDQAFMGYGEMNEDGTKFKDVSKLKFDTTMPMSKTECAK